MYKHKRAYERDGCSYKDVHNEIFEKINLLAIWFLLSMVHSNDLQLLLKQKQQPEAILTN